MSVRVRIAPSPTGDPHVGTAYMALFNLIFARHHEGKFILRIEDTDRTRSRPEYEDNIYQALHWCDIRWDEGPDVGGPYGPYRQSERTEIYQHQCQKLLDQEKAYKCFCTADDLEEMRLMASKLGKKQGYDRRCRNLSKHEIAEKEAAGMPYVIRLKVPLTGDCVFDDAIKGRISTPYADIDDQVLMKSDHFPTYHLANVVDDHLMAISHVIRGDEWISSTPKHIYLYEAFGWKHPVFMHMPLLLGVDGKKLSKRRNPTSIFYYRDSGYLPEAFMNFLTLMGYSMPGDREIYPLTDIIKEFDVKRIGVSGAIFDIQKLEWLNQQYLINTIPEDKLLDRLKEWNFSDGYLQRLMPLAHTRIKTFGDFMALCDFFFINHLNYTFELFTIKELSFQQVCAVVQTMIWQLDATENWKSTGFAQMSKDIAEMFSINHKKVVMPILYSCLQGKRQGPPLFDSAEILGKDRTRARFLASMEFLGSLSKKKQDSLKKGYDSKELAVWLQENKE